MRKRISWLMVVFLLILVVSEAFAGSGDVNGDGSFDEGDAVSLGAYLVGDDVEINTIIADVNSDGSVGLSDLMTLERLLASGERPGDGQVTSHQVVYGKSVMGRDLVCTIIEPERYERTVLAVFAMHGYEGFYDKDGQTLVDAANEIIEYFKGQDTMYGCRLMVVACANPDGLEDGNSFYGFGHDNKQGVDINDNFDVNRPAPETQALMNLVTEYKPDVVLDFHGFDYYTVGSSELAVVFSEEMGRSHQIIFTSKHKGTFTFWAQEQGAKALMVYLPDPDFSRKNLTQAIERVVAHSYPEKNGVYTVDPVFAELGDIYCFALDTYNIRTYSDINGAETGYISGKKDWVVLEEIYENGWARVRYPIKEGYKIGYAYVGAFVDSAMRIDPLVSEGDRGRNIPVYTRNNLNYQWELIDRRSTFYVVARSENALQVVYPSQKGLRMGWIKDNAIDVDSLAAYNYSGEEDGEREEKKTYNATLYAAGVQIDGGQAFDLPVYVEADNLASLRLWVEYDGEAIELYAVDDGGTMTGFVRGEDLAANPYRVMWVNSEGDSEARDGLLVTFHFRARPTTREQETPLLVYARSGDALTDGLDRVKITLAPYEGNKE